MTKYLIYCRIHIMGSKCCVRNCKSGYKRQVKITETSFHKFREEWKNKIHWGGKWPMTEESFLCSKHFEWRYLDILKLKCCCLGLTMYTWLQWTQILCTMLLVLFPKCKKVSYLCCLWYYLWRKLYFRNQCWRYNPRK